MQKNEQKYLSQFHRWLKYNHWNTSFPFEFKAVEDGSRLNYKSDIRDSQLECLWLAKHKQLIYKISDASFDNFRPFDSFIFTDSPAYFVICWYEKGRATCYIIDIDAIINEINSDSKSLTEERAKEIAYKIGEIK